MQTDHFVPLVVPGLSTNSGSNSSSTSTLQDLSSPRAKWRTGPRRLVRITSSKTRNRNEKRDDNRNSDDRVRDLPAWLEEFTDNLEDTEVHAPAHVPQDSDSQRPTNVSSKSRKQSLYSHFPQDRNCGVCVRTKMTKALCRRRTGEAPPRAEKFGDLITADHKVLIEEGELRNNHRYAVVVQDLVTQRLQSYPCKTKVFSGDGKEFTKVFRAVTKATSYIYVQSIGICKFLWWFILESPHFRTSSIRDKWHCWKRRTKSERRKFSSIATIRIGWKMVGCFCGLLLPSAKRPSPPGRRENSLWKTIWRTTQRANNSFWSNGWISSDFRARSIKTSSIWQDSIARHLSWVGIDRGENLERRHSYCGSGRICKSWTHQKFILEEWTRKKYWYQKKRRLIHIPVADGPGKLSGRDHEFREPTRRREHRKERGSQWRTSRRNGRVSTDRINRRRWTRADFWPIQGDFIYRHHNEPRVQLYVPKEETFPIPLKYTDVTRSTHADLDVVQEERVDDFWNVDSNRSLSDSWKGCTKFTLLQEKPPTGCMCPGGDWQKFKRLPDQIMYGQKYGRKLVKPLRIEENKNGKTRRQNSTLLEDWEEFTSLILMTRITKKLFKVRGENWKDLWQQPCRAKRKPGLATLKWLRR